MCSSIITNFMFWFVHCSLPGMTKLPKYSIDWAYDHTFSSRKMRLKTSSAKWRPFNYLLQCVNGISIEHTRVKGGYINTQFKDASNDVLEKCVHFHDLSNHAFEIRRWRSWRCKKSNCLQHDQSYLFGQTYQMSWWPLAVMMICALHVWHRGLSSTLAVTFIKERHLLIRTWWKRWQQF